jgi:hypothetical protein
MWLNILGFNLSWFGLVLLGNSWAPLALLWVLVHVAISIQKSTEIIFIMMVMVTGVVVDSVLLYFGVFDFPHLTGLPVWLILLWACFATTIGHGLSFLSGSKVAQAFVGALLAPLSYCAGLGFGAVEFGHSIQLTYLILALIWGPLMVLFFHWYNRLVNSEMLYV